jgi:tetratricopeptide (TPR) repeat protein
MAETAVKLDQREAARLFERGVAAARGGQRRIAASLLSRAVQFDPRHEQAWLWLSGVIDDPNEIAFCLRSVLNINPGNDRARQGLVWLEQRALVSDPSAAPAMAISQVPAHENGHGVTLDAGHARESWWVQWRRSRREMNRAWTFVWATCIIVLLGLLGLNTALRDVVERNAELARAAQSQPASLSSTAPRTAPKPIVQNEIAWTRDSQALAYLSAIEEPRSQLRAAIDEYREATRQPGNSARLHSAATLTLRDKIEAARDVILKADPPPALEHAHTAYLAGLEQELAALEDMREFYGSFSFQLANRAVLRMEDAGKQLELARTAFEQSLTQAHSSHQTFPQTLR